MAATKLHEGMMTCDDLVAENDTETLSTLLNETDWYVLVTVHLALESGDITRYPDLG